MAATMEKINDFDLTAITNEVNRWKSNGAQADYDILDRDRGAVALFLQNVFRNDGSFIGMDIFKIEFPRFLGKRSAWVIQLFDLESRMGPAEMKGCIARKSLSGAITEAIIDVKYNYMSVLTRDQAIQSLA